MRISQLVQDSIVDGPGLRFVVFTQGCTHACPHCHNPGTHDLAGGVEMNPEEVIAEMERNPLTDGLTLSGGEPFLQSEDCAKIARAARQGGLNVWCYTGYTLETLKKMPGAQVLLDEIDVLVDGLFMQEQKNLRLPWRGSENQRIIERNCFDGF